MSDRLPHIGQQVILANVGRFRSEETQGCVKDVGVLKDGGNQLYWSTQGQMRAMDSRAFTHWMPIDEPTEDAKNCGENV